MLQEKALENESLGLFKENKEIHMAGEQRMREHPNKSYLDKSYLFILE